jgi:hypothetical protein
MSSLQYSSSKRLLQDGAGGVGGASVSVVVVVVRVRVSVTLIVVVVVVLDIVDVVVVEFAQELQVTGQSPTKVGLIEQMLATRLTVVLHCWSSYLPLHVPASTHGAETPAGRAVSL